jgi:hypothetical protein
MASAVTISASEVTRELDRELDRRWPDLAIEAEVIGSILFRLLF